MSIAVRQERGQGEDRQLAPTGRAGSVQASVEELNSFREFVRAALVSKLDYGVIPGTEKPTLYQPGAQKIAMYYNCYGVSRENRAELPGGHLEVVASVDLVSRTTGNVVASGVGSCTTMESRYRWRNAQRTCPRCGHASIIKGKEEFGGGWVCFKKSGGCGAKYRDDEPAITDQPMGRVENPDIYDQRNTVLKMAVKRAYVAAAIALGCAAELFTQDLEDLPPLAWRQDIDVTPEPESPSRSADPPRTAPRRRADPEPATRAAPPRDAGSNNSSDYTARELYRRAAVKWIELERGDQTNGQLIAQHTYRLLNHTINWLCQSESLIESDICIDGKRDNALMWDAVDSTKAHSPKPLIAEIDRYIRVKAAEAQATAHI